MRTRGTGDRAATAETSTATADDRAVELHVVDVEGIPMSALFQEVERPRAVIVALHGGATSSAYFHPPGLRAQSLLRTGAALGFTVVALDRPGYGASAAHDGRMTRAERRIDLAYAAVDRLLGRRPRGAGVFVMAHSLGSVLALRMAADERGGGLIGLELAGTGVRHHPRSAEILDARFTGEAPPEGERPGLRDLVWGPDGLYPEDVLNRAGIVSSTPRYEADEVRSWPRECPEVVARVRIPVRYCLGDHELVWDPGPSAMAGVAALFTASPRVVVDRQAYGPHNLSLGRSATAYHLKVLSFVEECVLAREDADSTGDRIVAGDAAAGPGR